MNRTRKVLLWPAKTPVGILCSSKAGWQGTLCRPLHTRTETTALGFPPFELEARVGVYTTVVPLQVCFLRQTVTRFDLSLLVCCIFLFLSSECYFKSVGVFYLRKKKKFFETLGFQLELVLKNQGGNMETERLISVAHHVR